MKYYVVSGEFKRIVTAKSSLDAAMSILKICDGETLEKYIYIDERGFRTDTANYKILLNNIVKVVGND